MDFLVVHMDSSCNLASYIEKRIISTVLYLVSASMRRAPALGRTSVSSHALQSDIVNYFSPTGDLSTIQLLQGPDALTPCIADLDLRCGSGSTGVAAAMPTSVTTAGFTSRQVGLP